MYDFLLVSTSNYTSISLRLAVIDPWKIFSYLLILGPNVGTHSLPYGEQALGRIKSTSENRRSFCVHS